MRKTATLLLVLILCGHFTTFGQNRPNVIYISVDDLNIAFDSYVNPEVPTPNISRLASHGTLFKVAYCQYALCNPSRTSSLSGQRPDKTGVFDNLTNSRIKLGKDFKFIPEYFHSYGYWTERYGKVGPCGNELTISYDWSSQLRSKSYKVEGVPYWWVDTTAKTEDETFHGRLTDEMLGRMRAPAAQPYYYAYAMSTHNPFTPILSNWNKLGDPTVQEKLKVDMDGNYSDVRGNGSGNIILPNTPPDDINDIPAPALKDPIIYPEDEWRRMRHAYYSGIIELDDILGKLLDELDRTNAWDNTIIVFSSDHGVHLGEHNGQWLKQTLFEESLRVPFIICAPGMKRGAVCDRPVELVDIFATMNELAGLPAPPDNQGSSLVPLLQNPEAVWKKAIFGQVRRQMFKTTVEGRSVRTETFSYNNWGSYGEELYDIVNDPYEYTNLAGNVAYEGELNNMRTLFAGGWQNALPPAYQKRTFFEDKDNDGYGGTNSVQAYFAPDGYTEIGGDCDDTDPNVNPGAPEKLCNGIDDNCNGKIDEGLPVPPISAIGNTDICQKGSVTLKTIGKAKAYSYQWYNNGVKIDGATRNRYIAENPGDYTVEVSQKGTLCASTSKAITVTNSCPKLSIGKSDNLQISQADFRVYPSPSNGNLIVNFTSSAAERISIKVIDLNGKVLYNSPQNIANGANSIRLNLSNLPSGIYHLQVQSSKETLVKKFVIEK